MSDKPISLNAARFKNADEVRAVKLAVVPVGTTIEQMLEPVFWAHVARELQPNFEIIVQPDDGSFYQRLFVRSCGANWAIVAPMDRYEFGTAETVIAEVQTHQVMWSGPHTKYRVLRLSDKAVVKDGFATKEEAALWLTEHKKAIAA
jgi:hypothetical protein